jgi:hypothetical protein
MQKSSRKDQQLPSWALELIFTSASINLEREKENLFADVGTIGRCACVCKEWRAVSKSDAIWKELCGYVWDRRLGIASRVKTITPAIQAYFETVEDAKRKDLSLQELIQEEGWNFRFKEVKLFVTPTLWDGSLCSFWPEPRHGMENFVN